MTYFNTFKSVYLPPLRIFPRSFSRGRSVVSNVSSSPYIFCGYQCSAAKIRFSTKRDNCRKKGRESFSDLISPQYQAEIRAHSACILSSIQSRWRSYVFFLFFLNLLYMILDPSRILYHHASFIWWRQRSVIISVCPALSLSHTK